MAGFFLYALEQFGPPAPRDLLDGADIEIAVVKKYFEFGHLASEKPAILADGIAAHRRFAGLDPAVEKIEGFDFSVPHAVRAGANAIHQPRLPVLALVPVVHARERGLVLVDRDDRPFLDEFELARGDERRDLDDVVGLGAQPGHLEVDPDQMVGGRHDAGVYQSPAADPSDADCGTWTSRSPGS